MTTHYRGTPAAANTCLRATVRACATGAVGLLLAAAADGPAGAAVLYDSGGTVLRWDTTLRYSTAWRLHARNSALVSDPNADDGDRNFAPGLVSNRLDVFSQADLDWGHLGLRLSGAGWYDSIYTQRNDNDSPATFNPLSVPHDAFTRATRRLHGEHADLLDAYLHGTFALGDMPVTFRLGRHALLWGESLFFADNGVAAGQGPTDTLKELGEPQAKAAEIFLPVTQASAVLLPRPDLAVEFYYQFEWRQNRLPGSGSYFSTNDSLDAGGERLFVGSGTWLVRGPDIRPPGTDQFGIALHLNGADANYGVYALRFDAKTPQIYLRPDGSSGPGAVGTYQLVYPRDIALYGASFSTYLGDSNIAGELSYRQNMPLVSPPVTVAPGMVADGGAHPLYAIGDTLHAQLSSVADFGAGALWDGAEISAELAASEVLDITRNVAAFDPSRSRFALSFQAEIEPEYFRVLPNLDLRLPVDFAYGLIGDSGTSDELRRGAGDIEFAVEATFRNAWEARMGVTFFLGSPARQSLADRHFLSVSVQRTF